MSAGESRAVEYDVPEGEEPAVRCPYCDRPFRAERYATFHVGVRHPEECTPAEREAYESARDDQETEVFTFHVKASVAVLVTYFTFVFLYALVWGG